MTFNVTHTTVQRMHYDTHDTNVTVLRFKTEPKFMVRFTPCVTLNELSFFFYNSKL